MLTTMLRIRHKPTGRFVSATSKWRCLHQPQLLRPEGYAFVITHALSIKAACTGHVRSVSIYGPVPDTWKHLPWVGDPDRDHRRLTWQDGVWSDYEVVYPDDSAKPLLKFLEEL